MYSKEALQAMTVIELRTVARENGVKLSAGISKQGIVDRLCDALIHEEPAPTAQTVPAVPAAPAQRTAHIVADDDDTPILTPNAPFSRSGTSPRPAAARPAAPAAQPTVNRGNVPGTNKPVFSLEGVRAWHNPRTYQQSAGNNTYSQHNNTGYTQQRAASANTYGQQRIPQRPAPSVTRFGPASMTTDAPKPDAPQETYRSEPQAQPATPYQSDYRARRDSSPLSPSAALPDLLATGDITDGGGILELQDEGHGYLRASGYLPGNQDIYVSNAQIRRFHLHTGDLIHGKVRAKRENESHSMLLYITEINGVDAQDIKESAAAETLTPIYPARPIFRTKKKIDPMLQALNLLCPLGFGQRALVYAPQSASKTAFLCSVAETVTALHSDVQLFTLCLDQRPEDITYLREALPGENICTSFDMPAQDQLRIADLVCKRAVRLAEQKKDVIILLDSLTAFAQLSNDSAPAASRALACGLNAPALLAVKRLLGAARAQREGGSLTVIALLNMPEESAASHAISECVLNYANAALYLRADGKIDFARSWVLHSDALLSDDGKKAAAALKNLLHQDDGAQRLEALVSQEDGASALQQALLYPELEI